MNYLALLAIRLQCWRDKRGQDLIEYGLMAAFGALSAVAVMPNLADGITTIYSKISGILSSAANQGS